MQLPPNSMDIVSSLVSVRDKAIVKLAHFEQLQAQVNTFNHKTITKRLCTHIEDTIPTEQVERIQWNSETRQEETKTVSVPVYRVTLESPPSYSNSYKLNYYPKESNERETFYFVDIAELRDTITGRISQLQEGITRYVTEIESVHEILAKYHTINLALLAFNETYPDLSGTVRDHLPNVK